MDFLWEHQILVEITQLHRVFECQENTLVPRSQGYPIDPNVKPWHRAFP